VREIARARNPPHNSWYLAHLLDTVGECVSCPFLAQSKAFMLHVTVLYVILPCNPPFFHHASSLKEEERAKLCLAMAYAVHSLYYMLLRTRVSRRDAKAERGRTRRETCPCNHPPPHLLCMRGIINRGKPPKPIAYGWSWRG
jgi:hypothetical protein